MKRLIKGRGTLGIPFSRKWEVIMIRPMSILLALFSFLSAAIGAQDIPPQYNEAAQRAFTEGFQYYIWHEEKEPIWVDNFKTEGSRAMSVASSAGVYARIPLKFAANNGVAPSPFRIRIVVSAVYASDSDKGYTMSTTTSDIKPTGRIGDLASAFAAEANLSGYGYAEVYLIEPESVAKPKRKPKGTGPTSDLNEPRRLSNSIRIRMFFRDANKMARYNVEKASSADALAFPARVVEPKGPSARLVDAAIPAMPRAHRYGARALAIAPDGKTLVTAGEDGTKLWTLPEGELRAALPETKDTVTAVAISQDGKWLAAGVQAIRPEHKSSVQIWSLPDLKLHATLTGFGDAESLRPQLDVGFGPEGLLAVSEMRGKATLWKWPEGEWQAEPSDKVNAWKLAFSSDGATLNVLSFETGVSIWNLPEVTPRASLPELSSFDILGGVAFAPDGKMLAASGQSENSVSIWSLPDGKPLAKLSGHAKLVNAIAFAPEGRRIATGSRDNTVKIWELPEGKLIATLKAPGTALFGIKQLLFAPDGKSLVAADDEGFVFLWELGQMDRCSVLYDQDLQTKK
jgi:hypothetical protein